MVQILVTKPGTLTAADRKKLRASGVVTIEAENPGDVRLIGAEGPPMDGNDLAYAALYALAKAGDGNYVSTAQSLFTKTLADIVSTRRAKSRDDA